MRIGESRKGWTLKAIARGSVEGASMARVLPEPHYSEAAGRFLRVRVARDNERPGVYTTPAGVTIPGLRGLYIADRNMSRRGDAR